MKKYKLYNKYINDESKFVSLMIERINYNINHQLPSDLEANIDYVYTESKQKMLEYVFKKKVSDVECTVVYSPDLKNVIDTMGTPCDVINIINTVENIKAGEIMADILYLNTLLEKK